MEIQLTDGMMISGIILAVTFIGIFTETLHGFHRSKVAMLGAGVMLVTGMSYGFYDPAGAFKAVDWNVVFLLGCMMAIVSIMIKTGGFEVMATNIGRISKGRKFMLMALLGTAVTGLSLLLDNVTTVVIFGPLIILICQSLKITPIPYLLAAALLSDTGGVATLVGDPPNLMIGSAFGIDFNTFVIHMGGIVLLAWLGTLTTLRVIFRKELSTPAEGTFEDRIEYKDKPLWNKSIFVLLLMVVLFVIHGTIHWQPWMVSGLGLIILVFLGKSLDLDEVMEKVEMQLLIFFISLFMLVGGVEGSQFLEYLGQFIIPFVESDLFMATLILMWVAAVMSAAIDNIPFTAAMIPIIASIGDPALQTPLLWALALGVGMGGNGTHIGSTANVFIVTISERLAKDTGDPSLAITPLKWFRYGLPVMIVTLIICSIVLTLFWDFYANPLDSIVYNPNASGH